MLRQGDESPIAAVRRRVVQLLGHLGGQLNRSLVTGELLLWGRGSLWMFHKHLKKKKKVKYGELLYRIIQRFYVFEDRSF